MPPSHKAHRKNHHKRKSRQVYTFPNPPPPPPPAEQVHYYTPHSQFQPTAYPSPSEFCCSRPVLLLVAMLVGAGVIVAIVCAVVFTQRNDSASTSPNSNGTNLIGNTGGGFVSGGVAPTAGGGGGATSAGPGSPGGGGSSGSVGPVYTYVPTSNPNFVVFGSSFGDRLYNQYQETTLLTHTLGSSSTWGAMTGWWAVTGNTQVSPDTCLFSAVWRYYIDSETTASIQFNAPLFTGIGFNDTSAPWGDLWVSKDSNGGGYANKMRIPFQQSVKVTVTFAVAGCEMWFKVVGVENYPMVFGALVVPPTARLVQYSLAGVSVPASGSLVVAPQAGASVYPFFVAFSAQGGSSCAFANGGFTAAGGATTLSSTTAGFFNYTTHSSVAGGSCQRSGFRITDTAPVVYSTSAQVAWTNGDSSAAATVWSYSFAYVWSGTGGSAPSSAPSSTFGSASSPMALSITSAAEATVFSYTVPAGAANASLNYFGVSSSSLGFAEMTFFRYYLDGEATASVSFFPDTFSGTGLGDTNAYTTQVVGRMVNKLAVPFYSSLRITAQASPAISPGYFPYALSLAVAGAVNASVVVQGVVLPSFLRLKQYTVNRVSYNTFQFVQYAAEPSGSGVVVLHSLLFMGGEAAYEGCYRLCTPYGASAWPCVVLSSGTEDYFDSAYNFDAGQYWQDNAGGTAQHNQNGNFAYFATQYRVHYRDPLFFQGGFEFLSRVNDLMPAPASTTTQKCLTAVTQGYDFQGQPNGTFYAYTLAYVWNGVDTVSSTPSPSATGASGAGTAATNNPYTTATSLQLALTGSQRVVVTGATYSSVFSLAFWVAFTACQPAQQLVTGSDGLVLSVTNSQWYLNVQLGGVTTSLMSSHTLVALNTAYFVVLTMTAVGEWSLYVDGQLLSPGFLDGNFLGAYQALPSGARAVGVASAPTTGYLWGAAYYNGVALDTAQVAGLYAVAAPTLTTKSTHALSSYSQAVLASHPTLYWPLDEACQGQETALDYSGNGFTGTYRIAIPTPTGSDVTGVSISGATISTNAWFMDEVFTATYSVELWFATTSTSAASSPQYLAWVALGLSTAAYGIPFSVYLDQSGAGTLYFDVEFGTTLHAASPAYNDGNHHHVVATSSCANGLKLYVDGALASSAQTCFQLEQKSVMFGVGGGYTGGVSRVAFYVSELTLAQVQAHYSAGH
jgi:hypothetical protein